MDLMHFEPLMLAIFIAFLINISKLGNKAQFIFLFAGITEFYYVVNINKAFSLPAKEYGVLLLVGLVTGYVCKIIIKHSRKANIKQQLS